MADEEDDDAPRSPWGALIGLLVIVVIGVGVWYIIGQLHSSAAMQDCLASGRTNCAPINTHQ